MRVPDETWVRALARAEQDGTSVSAAVQWFLREYVEGRVTPSSQVTTNGS